VRGLACCHRVEEADLAFPVSQFRSLVLTPLYEIRFSQ
jgi:hypothetical protein